MAEAQLTWGATQSEVARPMPDDLVARRVQVRTAQDPGGLA